MSTYLAQTDLTSKQRNTSPFHQGRYHSAKQAWAEAINENYWRHGLVFSQGNKMNVSEERCRERLKFISSRLLRQLYGNKHRRTGHQVHFIAAAEGRKTSHNLHHHILLAVDGDHGWSDFRIKMTIQDIDILFLEQFGWNWEKPIHINYKWQRGNRYHSYSTDSIQRGRDDWTIWSSQKDEVLTTFHSN